jgi:hypothetical protein
MIHDRCPLRINSISLVNCNRTRISFEDETFEVTRRRNRVKIAIDDDNYVIIGLKDQQVPYKANILGGFVPAEEERRGEIDYSRYFSVHWSDDFSVPDLLFAAKPQEIAREYDRGQFIELGLEDLSTYRVFYRDGVEASFERRTESAFEFSFSTGFYGSFEEHPDGSYTLTFKGDRLKPGEDDLSSQSKFIVSRSKLTGKLLLYLWDGATVRLY